MGYQTQFTGNQIDTAIMKALAGGIPDGTITVEKLAEVFKLPSEKLADGAITLKKLADEVIRKIENVEIKTDNLSNDFQLPGEKLADKSITAEHIKDHIIGLPILNKDVIGSYSNLYKYDPNDETDSSGFTIENLIPGKSYCYNSSFVPHTFDGNGYIEIKHKTKDGCTYISAEDMLYDSVTLFHGGYDVNLKQFMFVEGNVVPDHFKPYGIYNYINDVLLASVYDEIKQLAEKALSPVSVNDLENSFELPGDKLEKSSVTAEHIKDYTIGLQELASEIINSCKNLLNPADITKSGYIQYINIHNLTGGSTYSLSVIPNSVNVNDISLTTNAINNGISFTLPEDASYVNIIWPGDTDLSQVMLVEGNVLPQYIKPYGIETYLNDELLISVYEEIKRLAKRTLSSVSVDNLNDDFKLPGNKLSKNSIVSEHIKNYSIGLQELDNDVISTCTNLLNPKEVYLGDNTAEFNIYVESGKTYCFNFTPTCVELIETYGYNEEGNHETIIIDITNSLVIESQYTYIPEGVIVAQEEGNLTIHIVCSSDETEIDNCMLVEGNTLPVHFKPYGVENYINDELLASVYAEIETETKAMHSKIDTAIDDLKPDIKTLSGDNLNLQNNIIYSLTVSSPTSFHLPSKAENGDKIIVQADVQADGVIEHWGTEYFFNEAFPRIQEGKYNFTFEFDNGIWYAKAELKGYGGTAPSPKTLDSISVVSMPDKLTYISGDIFDPTGLNIVAFYSDGSTESLSDSSYSFLPSGALNASDNQIIVFHTYNNTTKMTAIGINVIDAKPVLSENTWDTIAKVSELGRASELWAVGDKTSITCNDQNVAVEIIGFDHDRLSGFSEKAGITFMTVQLIGKAAMHTPEDTNIDPTVGGWGTCDMRNIVLPTFQKQLSGGVEKVIKKVDKDYYTLEDDCISTSDDYLFLISTTEAGYAAPINIEGTVYERFADGLNSSRLRYTSDGTAADWWTRSVYNSDRYSIFKYNGVHDFKVASSIANSIAFAFCV